MLSVLSPRVRMGVRCSNPNVMNDAIQCLRRHRRYSRHSTKRRYRWIPPFRSLRQVVASLLKHHVFCVPVRSIRIFLANSLLMLTVSGRCATKRCRQIVHRGKRRLGRIDAAG
jgi:hypothetical protein